MENEKQIDNNQELPDNQDKANKEKELILELIKWRRNVREEALKKIIGEKAFNFLDKKLRYLLIASTVIDEAIESYAKITNDDFKHVDLIMFAEDRAFVAFPAAKAFEGFIIKLLLKLRLLKKADLKEDPFVRIGSIINKDEFEKSIKDKRFRPVPKKIQAEWDISRNFLLHYDAARPKDYSQQEARERIEAILEIIKMSCDAFLRDERIAKI